MLKDERIRRRRKDNIRLAERPREFSAEETMKMAFDMIDFALELNKGAKVEEGCDALGVNDDLEAMREGIERLSDSD